MPLQRPAAGSSQPGAGGSARHKEDPACVVEVFYRGLYKGSIGVL